MFPMPKAPSATSNLSVTLIGRAAALHCFLANGECAVMPTVVLTAASSAIAMAALLESTGVDGPPNTVATIVSPKAIPNPKIS
jgi:hypothetical protein